MSRYETFAVAAALAFAVGCGNAPDPREGGGGADGFGDDKRPTAAERTGATGDSGRGAGMGMANLSDEDRQFLQQAAMSNQMEVALANLAEDKAERDDIKQFGEQLARDHEAANRELQASIGGGDATTAQQPGGGVSNQPDRAAGARDAGSNNRLSHRENEVGQQGQSGATASMQQQMQDTQQKLESVSGAAFDRAYLEEMIKHHQHDIQQFERAAQSDNPQVRAYAERTLPTLRQHLQQAQQLQQQAQGSGRQ